MNRDNLLDLHRSLCGSAYEIMKAKNHDYTGGSPDPFLNFRHAEVVGVRAELGLLVRVMDKIMRLRTFIHHGRLAVTGEAVQDSIVDVINYMVLLAGLIEERMSDGTVAGLTTWLEGYKAGDVSYGGTE